jgi:hypothetical protein
MSRVAAPPLADRKWRDASGPANPAGGFARGERGRSLSSVNGPPVVAVVADAGKSHASDPGCARMRAGPAGAASPRIPF